MKLIEYRIFMPLTIEENLIGQLWSFAEVSRQNTGGGEGVTINKNQFFEIPYDVNGKISVSRLPEYDEYEPQDAPLLGGKASFINVFKKSASKENFEAAAAASSSSSNKDAPHDERKKSIERTNIVVSARITDGTTDSTSGAHDSGQNSSSGNALAPHLDLNRYGQYTHKIYLIGSKLPWYVRKLLPKDSTIVNEKSWNMYPVVKTVLTNEYFKNISRIELDTITQVCSNGVPEENVHNLSAQQLLNREVVDIDITEQVARSEYKEDEDPTLFRSKDGRGPLSRGGDWPQKQRPLICIYKLVFVEFKVFGLQTRAESYIKSMYKQLFLTFHRQVFCWMDKWIGLCIEDLRRIETDLAKVLVEKIDQGELSKNCLVDADKN